MPVANTVIVGAGPYGLSIAAHLKAAGIPFQLYGTPMESWRKFMPVGMVLKSERFASNLWDPDRRFTLERYSAERKMPYQPAGVPLSLRDFLDYAEWFRQRGVGESIDKKISNIRRTRSGFALDFAGGDSLEARSVILATGHMAFRVIPEEFSSLPEPFCYHSSAVNDVTRFAQRDVTVIGAGQSALESAALLQEAGARVRVIVRESKLAWNAPRNGHNALKEKIMRPESGLGFGWESMAISELPQWFRRLFPVDLRHRYVAKTWGPTGAWWLKQRVEGRMEILVNHKVLSARQEQGRVRLEVQGPDDLQNNGLENDGLRNDGPKTGALKTIWTDHVIAATGYKVDLERIDCLAPELRQSIAREHAAPVLNSQFETSVPGLFMVGIASAPTFGPVMRFMFGAKHAAPVLARRLR
ncbi:MAG TPA: NAD(P)-binding domain-containing protein [Candidatus Angelobacter sp.]|nr:NAD(P)-binding domain-containing protein [Candidatus Angelobacter sp.]